MQAMSPAISSPVPVAGKTVASNAPKAGNREFENELKTKETTVSDTRLSDADIEENAADFTAGENVENKVALDEDLEFLSDKTEAQSEEQQAVPVKIHDVLQQFILRTNKKLSSIEGTGESKPEEATSKGVLTKVRNASLRINPQSMQVSKQSSIDQTVSDDSDGVLDREDTKPNLKADKSVDVEPKTKTEVSTVSNSMGNGKTVDTVQPVPQPVNAHQAGQLSPPAKSILTAIQENSNWSKQLSSPVLQTMTQMQNSGAVLQSLQVQLHPVELGSVNLKLRLVQGHMQVEVAVENDAAYQALVADQDSLVNTVRAMGFKVESLSISNSNGQSSLMGQEKSENDGAESGSSGGSDDANIENDFGRDTSVDSASGIDGQSHIYI